MDKDELIKELKRLNSEYIKYSNNTSMNAGYRVAIMDAIDLVKKLTYKERIDWFVANFYETGMEYQIIYDSFKNEDLDRIKWYDDFIKIPEYKDELQIDMTRDEKIHILTLKSRGGGKIIGSSLLRLLTIQKKKKQDNDD